MQTWRKLLLNTVALIIVILSAWFPRALNLDRFVTPDEPKWLTRSANFYTALVNLDLSKTYQKEHPGVTITWAGALDFLFHFPEYATQGPGQIGDAEDADVEQVEYYLRSQGYEPIDLLAAGRLFVVIGIVVSLAMAFQIAKRLVGLTPAIFGFLLLAFDPFHIALSRLLHLDGLASCLMLLSILAFLSYLHNGRTKRDLILSAVAAGLGWLTKSPSLFLIPFYCLLLMLYSDRNWFQNMRVQLVEVWHAIKPIILWTGIASAVFVLLWPAMWVNPIQTLKHVFSEAASYAIEGHSSATFFNGVVYQNGDAGWFFYPLAYLWRTTPVVLIGVGSAILSLVLRSGNILPQKQRSIVRDLLLYAVLFSIFMTIGSKKFDRYLLPVFPALDILAAIGIVHLSRKLFSSGEVAVETCALRWQILRVIPGIILLGMIVFQASSAISTHPYYFSYYNPVMGGSQRAPEVMMIGWGEGLDEAARYLNSKPNADQLKVLSWYPNGCFSYFFKGETVHIWSTIKPRELAGLDYVVVYIHQWQRISPNPEYLEFFSERIPEHTIMLDGLEYAHIYRMDEP